MSLIEFSQLTFGYTDERIIDGATAALHAGEVAGLVGASGCGKPTLLNLILGKLSPESGQAPHARTARIALLPAGAVHFASAPGKRALVAAQ